MYRIIAASIAYLLCSVALTAQAMPIAVAPTASGELVEKQQCASPGCFSLDYEYRNPLQALSFVSTLVPGDGRVNTGLGYLVFDLGSISASTSSAHLRLDLNYAQAVDPQLTVAALPASVVPPLTTIGPGTTAVSFFDMTPGGMAAFAAAQTLYESINGGSELGTAGLSGPFSGVIDISLNSQAISQINSAGGLWGVGLRWTPTPEGPFFNNSDIITLNSTPQLLLTLASPVPVPGSAALLILSLLLLRRKLSLSGAL